VNEHAGGDGDGDRDGDDGEETDWRVRRRRELTTEEAERTWRWRKLLAEEAAGAASSDEERRCVAALRETRCAADTEALREARGVREITRERRDVDEEAGVRSDEEVPAAAAAL